MVGDEKTRQDGPEPGLRAYLYPEGIGQPQQVIYRGAMLSDLVFRITARVSSVRKGQVGAGLQRRTLTVRLGSTIRL